MGTPTATTFVLIWTWKELEIFVFEISNNHLNNLYNIFYKDNQIDNKIIYNFEWFQNLCNKIKTDINYDINCLGSLGCGNHYIEINIDDNNLTYITVHTGSRNLGQKVCNFHQNILNQSAKFNWNEFNT